MRTLKKKKSYWPYFRSHLLGIILALVLSAISTGGNFASTHVLSAFVDKISSSDFTSIDMLVLLLFFIETASRGLAHISAKIIIFLKSKIIKQLRWKILGETAEASVESVAKNAPCNLATTSSEDAILFVDAIKGIYGEVFNVLLGLAALIYTVLTAWQLAVLLILSFAIILIVQYFAIKKMVEAQKKARSASVSVRSFLVQTFQAFADFKVQNLRIKSHVAEALEEEMESNVRAEKIVLNNQLLSEVLGSLVQCLFLGLSVILILNSRLDLGGFVAIFMYKGYVFGLVGAILRIARNKSQATTAVQRMDSILDYKVVSKEVWGTTRLKNPSGEIVIENLIVDYGDTRVIDNLSVKLPAGKFIGIVGPSGCGKSTVVNVLAKVVTPTSGSVKMDGIELSDLTETSYRRAITLALQTPFMFNFSIRQNLLLANPKASDEKIWDCLRQCAADKFVLEKGGLDSVLTPKQLSGGQRQRLALARIALRGGKVVLLDESTSALDGESQAVVLKTIREAADMGHTMVLVAHRVSTLKEADLILVMEKGKILETGTYAELYEKSEKFRRLANLG